jgi:hypothetical protein
MKFKIERESWIVGGITVPPTTIVDTSELRFAFAKGHVPPLNAVALDDEAYSIMRKAYVARYADPIHPSKILSGPDVKR